MSEPVFRQMKEVFYVEYINHSHVLKLDWIIFGCFNLLKRLTQSRFKCIQLSKKESKKMREKTQET